MTDPTTSGYITVTVEQIEELEEDQRILNECGAHAFGWGPGISIGGEHWDQSLNFNGWRWLRPLLLELLALRKDDKAALQEGYRIISEEQQRRIKHWRGRFEELEGRIKIYETFTGGKISRHPKGFIP